MCLAHVYDMTHHISIIPYSYVCHDSSIFVTRLAHILDHACVCAWDFLSLSRSLFLSLSLPPSLLVSLSLFVFLSFCHWFCNSLSHSLFCSLSHTITFSLSLTISLCSFHSLAIFLSHSLYIVSIHIYRHTHVHRQRHTNKRVHIVLYSHCRFFLSQANIISNVASNHLIQNTISVYKSFTFACYQLFTDTV